MKIPTNDISGTVTGKEVYVITTGQIIGAKTAGARRVLNIARSLAYVNIKVIILSLADFNNSIRKLEEIEKGIYGYCSSDHSSEIHQKNLHHFLRVSNQYIKGNSSDAVFYLYPTTFIVKDLVYLLYFKYLKGYRFYCEINELRSSIAFASTPPEGVFRRLIYLIKSIRDYSIYKANEWQVRLYDGVTVISVALEKYYVNSSRRLIRIPILCNRDDISPDSSPRVFEGGIFKLCFAGYVKIDKEGFGLLLESISMVNRKHRIELFLYGLMEEEDSIRLKNLASKYCLSDQIIYMGNIDPECLKREFSKYHLLILPRPLNRRTMYGLSTKLSEYLASNTPVLVTDVSDNSLFIQDNYNGFIIQPGSTESMAQKLSEIISSYNILAHEVVENAHRTVREKLDYRLFSHRYYKFFFGEKMRYTD